MRFDLYSPEAQSLRNSLAVAGEALEEAGSAIRMLLKPSWIRIGSNDVVFALRRDGLAYAQAVRQNARAVMAWLVFVDKQIHIMDNKC